jgi:hypothetical protein
MMGLWGGGDMDMSVERSRGSNGSEGNGYPLVGMGLRAVIQQPNVTSWRNP